MPAALVFLSPNVEQPSSRRSLIGRSAVCAVLPGIKSSDGHREPRLYDLRHTFACRRLLLWYRQGLDVNQRINWLSTYLGHARVTDTYWYLSGVPELMSIAAGRFERSGRLTLRSRVAIPVPPSCMCICSKGFPDTTLDYRTHLI